MTEIPTEIYKEYEKLNDYVEAVFNVFQLISENFNGFHRI